MSDYGDEHGTSHDYSSHSYAYDDQARNNHSSISNALPSYEDAVGSFRASKNHDRHCSTSAADRQYPKRDTSDHNYQHYPYQHTSDRTSFDVYDQRSIFDSPSRNAERRDQTKPSPAFNASKARRTTSGSEQRSTRMSKCTICLIASFVVIVVSILLVWTFVKW